MARELVVDARLRTGSFAVEVRLEVDRGPLIVVGPNGAGKTTLLRALAGGPVQVDGRIAVCGRPVVDRGLWVPPEARGVGYLPQRPSLFAHLSVRDNAAFGARGDRPARQQRGMAALESVGAAHLADRRAAHLSGGEAQRVALARALAADPVMLLLDEPTAWLDVAARRDIRALLGDLVAARPAVAVTHDPRDLLAWGGQVAVVEGGVVRGPRPLSAWVADPGSPFVEELVAPLGHGSA